MKIKFLVVLGMALLAIQGAAAGTATSACLVADPGATAALGGTRLPWQEPENAAVPAPGPLCPEFRPCSGSACSSSGPCTSTDTGKRCCYDSSLTQHCCPAGTTVHAVVCPCVGTCTTATMQTAACL